MLSLALLPLVLWVAARVAWQPHNNNIQDNDLMHNHDNKDKEDEVETYSDSQCTMVSRVVMAAIFLLLFFIALV